MHRPALLFLLGFASTLSAQEPHPASIQPGTLRPWVEPTDPAVDFLSPYGLENFSKHQVDALSAFLHAEKRTLSGQYGWAKAWLDDLWSEHPPGGNDWGALPTQPFGLNIGSPTGYYGLRMLSDMVEWRLTSGVEGDTAPRSVRFTVLLVGASSGIEPRNNLELFLGTGVPVTHYLEPEIEADDHFVVHQSLRLFRDYVFAITEGQLSVETNILALPEVTLPVEAVLGANGFKSAAPVNANQVFDHVSEEDQAATDWWWLLYPSHVPEQYPDFATTEFITGGIGTGPDSLSPFFIIDDRWLLRKPPHLGSGPYSKVERRAYLPQWLQHEFFHHLFRTYPEFELEASSHQWFDPSTWPADFVGKYEADYYHEALVKRLQSAEPPLRVALRYATADAPWDELEIADVLGSYEHHPIQNDWHIGEISQVAGNQLYWQNAAGVGWALEADLLGGALVTGPDCPYFGVPNGDQFSIVLERDELGDLTSTVEAFAFLGSSYSKTSAAPEQDAAPGPVLSRAREQDRLESSDRPRR